MTYTNITKVETLKSGETTLEIYRVEMVGTGSIFFYPQTIDGKRLSKTLFARKYDAVNLANAYFNHLINKSKIAA